MDKEETSKVDLGTLGSFGFTPDWAKKDAGVTLGKGAAKASRFAEGEARERDGRVAARGERKPFVKKSFDRKGGGFGAGGGKSNWEKPKPLDAEVKVLPETKALGTIIRKLQNDYHAYKLKDLAYFFLDNPSSVLLRITPKVEGEKIYQCKACGFAALNEEDVASHILNAHLGDYYDSKEVECEAPKGNFNCVAKCGLTGVLLGPPNVHEFNSIVKEMIRTKFPNMSEEEYRSHIEMVRDAEAIEQWRAGATKRVIFTAKGAGEDAAILTREQAEGEFKRTILASLMDVPKHALVTLEMALKTPSKPLLWAARDAVEAEKRAPYGMLFALRGAFHHRKMHFFRANDPRGPEFVTNVELKEFDMEHAIPELVKVAAFIAEHPCAPKVDIAPDAEAEQHLVWLATTGHVVAFTNGVFSAVEKNPKYGPQWQKKWKTKSAEVKSAEEAKSAESAAVEAPAPGAESAAPVAAEELNKNEEKKEETNETSNQLAE
jgi:hypothetical protein